MDLHDFIELAREYQSLGWAVQEQLDDVLDGESADDKNPNALRLIRTFLGKCERAGIDGATDAIAVATETSEA